MQGDTGTTSDHFLERKTIFVGFGRMQVRVDHLPFLVLVGHQNNCRVWGDGRSGFAGAVCAGLQKRILIERRT